MIDFHPTTIRCYRCSASSWECIGEFVPMTGKRQDVLECAFCGVRMRVEAAAVPAAAKQPADTAEFRFQYGRFKGMTLAEADAEPNGRRYLEHLRDTNEKLRKRIAEYLAENGVDVLAKDAQIVCVSELPGATDCHASPASSPRLFGPPKNQVGGS